MGELLALELPDGGSVLVETESASSVATRGGGPAEALTEAGQSLEQVLGRLGPAVQAIVGQLRAAADWPSQVDVEFAVKISADANVIIARSGGEANFRIALRWTQEPR